MPASHPERPYTEDVTPLPPDWHYEATVHEIETIIGQIETGNLDLAEVFEQFDQAVQYLKQCDIFLANRQQQMDLMIEQLGDETQV